MDIERSKRIPISEILGKLNVFPQNASKSELRYFAPWRDEKTPSLFVNTVKNEWFDQGEGIGGDTLKFACTYLEKSCQDSTASDGLRWLTNISQDFPVEIILPAYSERKFEKEDSPLSLRSNKSITNIGLIHYLDKRGIPLNLAKSYLRELQVYNSNTNKRITCLGLPNEDGGFELRNPLFKACLRPKAISFIRGREAKPNGIHLFEGGFDYLSCCAQLDGRVLKDDVIILNSVSCIKQAMAYIHKYGYEAAFTWMDNDRAGDKATTLLNAFFKSEENLRHIPMNAVYAGYKDVNDWHVKSLRPSL